MKFSTKRIVSLVLSLLMCLSVFVFVPSVAETDLEALAASKLALSNGSKYVIDGAYLRNVGELTKVSSLVAGFSNSSVSVFGIDGAQLSSGDIAGTGATVSLMENGNKADTLTVIVLGDVSGDGEVNATDYLQIKAKFYGTLTLSDAAYSAADTDGDYIINANDYIRVKSYFVGDFQFPTIEPDESSADSSDVTSEPSSEEESSEEEIGSETRTNYAYEKSYTVAGDFLEGKPDNGTILTNGIIPTAEATGATVAFVGTGATNTVTINLGAKYIDINEIVVSGVVESGNRQYGSVTLSVSTNGSSYTALSGYSTSTSTVGSTTKYTYKLASATTAKYVRVTIVSSNYVLTLGEIEVYGGNAPAVEEPDPTPMPTDDKLFIAKIGDMYTDAENSTVLIFPGASVQSLYAYKLYAEYDANVNGYVVKIMAASHRSYFQTVPSNGIGIVFNFNPGEILGRNFARDQYAVWTKIRPGDIIRPSGINVSNKTADFTGSIKNNNLMTNAYFTVEYAPRNIPQTLYNGKTIVALGDSVTENGGWVESVSDLIGTTIINSGISGNTTTDCLARFDRDVAVYNPDIVLIMLGLNDVLPWSYSNENLNTYRRELGQLYDKCAAIGAKVIFMVPNDFKIDQLDYYSRYGAYGGLAYVYSQFRSAMKSVAAEKGCHCIDIYTPFHNTGDVYGHLIDTVHPNDYGYEIFKETISTYMLNNQASICG